MFVQKQDQAILLHTVQFAKGSVWLSCVAWVASIVLALLYSLSLAVAPTEMMEPPHVLAAEAGRTVHHSGE
jgi:hypothetical protein